MGNFGVSSHRKQTEVPYETHAVGTRSREMVVSVSLQNKSAAVSSSACRERHTFNMDLKSIFQGIFGLHLPYHWVTLVANSEFTTRHLGARLFLDDLKCRHALQRDVKSGTLQECNPGISCPVPVAWILGILKAGADSSMALGPLCSQGMCWNKWEVSAPIGNNELKPS